MARFGEKLSANKERLLFAVALAVLSAAAYFGFRPASAPPSPPDEPRVPPAGSAGAVLGAELLYASGDYWDENGRYVFVPPAPVRIFKPVPLEVPSLPPPRPPMPLPSPGPRLEYSGSLPRFGDSAALSAPAAPAAPAPAAPAAPAAGAGATPGGGK